MRMVSNSGTCAPCWTGDVNETKMWTRAVIALWAVAAAPKSILPNDVSGSA